MQPPADPRVFFQIAAALIPAMVFGGLLSDRLKPPDEWDPRSWRWLGIAAAVTLSGTAVFLAEVESIEVGLIGGADRSQALLVAGVVVGLTSVTVISVAWPWAKPLATAHPTPRGRRVVVGITAVAFIVMVGFTAVVMGNGVTTVQQVADDEQILANIQAQQHQAATDARLGDADRLLAFYQADAALRARAGLLSKAKARHIAVCIADVRLRGALEEEIAAVTGKIVRVPRIALFNLGKVAKGCGGLQTLP